MTETASKTGTARLLWPFLIVKTKTKRKLKRKAGDVYVFKDNVAIYVLKDVKPDKRVADPAFELTKVPDPKKPKIEVWHVSVGKWGPECDCPHATFNPRAAFCKHIKACRAVGLLS